MLLLIPQFFSNLNILKILKSWIELKIINCLIIEKGKISEHDFLFFQKNANLLKLKNKKNLKLPNKTIKLPDV